MRNLSTIVMCIASYITIFMLSSSSILAATMQLATVQVNCPNLQKEFVVGTMINAPDTGTGPWTFWHTIPAVLSEGTLQFDYLTDDPNKYEAHEYGKLDFTVQTDGPVWMLTTTRFGSGGNSYGDWLPEVSYQSDLEADGWNLILEGIETETGYNSFGENNVDDFGWLLFQRDSSTGETFSIRSEKYYAPVILQGVGVVVPEPSMLILFIASGIALCCFRIHKGI